MEKGLLYRFLVRWLVCSLGLWIAAGVLSTGITYESHIGVIIIAGLVLGIINAVLRPILIILSLPAILFSLGLFMIVINGFTVFLASKFYTSLHVTNFGAAMLAGIIIGLVNYLVTAILETRES
ncbi:MAG: phage holin family protein [Candidatus Saccharimonadales bacterium]